MLDNVAIVTGGSSGIGAEFARQLAGRGYNLLLVSNQSEQLATTKAAIEAEYPSVCCLTFFADLATPSAAADIEQFSRDIELTVEVLINNAGMVHGVERVGEIAQSDIEVMFNTNVLGLIALTQAIVVGMKPPPAKSAKTSSSTATSAASPPNRPSDSSSATATRTRATSSWRCWRRRWASA